VTEAQEKDLEAKRSEHLKVKNYLFQAIDHPILETISSKKTSKDIWASMKKKYQGSTRVKRAQLQTLRMEFVTLQMKNGESVTSYCGRVMEISYRMRVYGEKMEDVTIMDKILRSLVPKFDFVVCAIEESKDLGSLSLDELQSSLLVHEQKINRSSTVGEQALKVAVNTHSNFKRRGRGQGRQDHRGRDSSRNFKISNDQFEGRRKGRNHDKSKVECFRCHKFDHYASECYSRMPIDKEKKESAKFVVENEAETLLMAIQNGGTPELDI